MAEFGGGIFQSENFSSLLCWVVQIPIFLILVYSISKGDSRGRNLLLVYFIWMSFSSFWIILGNIIGGAPAYNLPVYFSLLISLAGFVIIIMLYRGSSKAWFDYHKERRKSEGRSNQKDPISNVESSPHGNLEETNIYRGPMIFFTFTNVVLALGAMVFCFLSSMGLGMTRIEANYSMHLNNLYTSLVTILILTIDTVVSWIVYPKNAKNAVIIAGLTPVISVICFIVGLVISG